MSEKPEQPEQQPLATRIPAIVNHVLLGLLNHAPRINMPRAFHRIISDRLMRLRARLHHLLARGPIAPRPPRQKPRNPPANPAPEIQKPAPEYHLPTRFAWLSLMFRGTLVTTAGNQLQTLLDEPETQALIATHPTLARSIRPLCHMLGIKPPACLKRTPRPRIKPARPKPSAPRKPPTPRKSWSPPPPPRPMAPWEAQLAARQFLNPRDFLP